MPHGDDHDHREPRPKQIKLPSDLEERLIQKLDEAGLDVRLAQRIIESPGNLLAESLVDLFKKYLGIVADPESEFVGFYCGRLNEMSVSIERNWQRGDSDVCRMSIHHKHELLVKLSSAGFSKEIAEAIVGAEGNWLARMFVGLLFQYDCEKTVPSVCVWLGIEWLPSRKPSREAFGV